MIEIVESENKMIEIVEDEITNGPAPGECFYYHEGTAEVLLCTKTSEAAGDRVKLVSGFLFNNGTTDLCGIKLQPAGVEPTAVQSVWPDWVADEAAGKDPFIFGARQTVDIGELRLRGVFSCCLKMTASCLMIEERC